MRYSSVLVCTSLLLVACSTPPADSSLRDTSFQAFADLHGEGWRGDAERGRYGEAATLIERYLAANAGGLDPWQVSVLQFHRAEMLACAGNDQAALALLPAARLASEPKDLPVDWNAMVDAVEAFLRHDRPALVEAQKRINAHGDAKVDLIEQAKVDAMFREFGRSYRRAYLAGIESAHESVTREDL